jgi:hypothetical protein
MHTTSKKLLFSKFCLSTVTLRETHPAHTFEYQRSRKMWINTSFAGWKTAHELSGCDVLILLNNGIIILHHLRANKLRQDGLTEVNMELCFPLSVAVNVFAQRAKVLLSTATLLSASQHGVCDAHYRITPFWGAGAIVLPKIFRASYVNSRNFKYVSPKISN